MYGVKLPKWQRLTTYTLTGPRYADRPVSSIKSSAIGRSVVRNDYPFVPKTSLMMRRGDYWPLLCKDGSYGFCVFLSVWGHLHSGFVVGVLGMVSAEPKIPESGPVIPILEA